MLLTSDEDTGVAKGSARSVKGISIYDALSHCADLLDRFGGHAFAAGLALPLDRVDTLRELYAASAEFHEACPWRVLSNHEPVQVEAPASLRFAIVPGISEHRVAFQDNARTKEALGYESQDGTAINGPKL